MKKSTFSEQKIISVLKQAEEGSNVPALCRDLGISTATFYKWRSRYGGMSVSLLKRMYADEKLKAAIRKEILERKL